MTKKYLLDDVLKDDDKPARPAKSHASFAQKHQKLKKLGERILRQIEPTVARHKAGDKLVTLKEIMKIFAQSKYKTAPYNKPAIYAALKRQGIKPVNRGAKGRGKAAQYWYLDVKEALVRQRS